MSLNQIITTPGLNQHPAPFLGPSDIISLNKTSRSGRTFLKDPNPYIFNSLKAQVYLDNMLCELLGSNAALQKGLSELQAGKPHKAIIISTATFSLIFLTPIIVTAVVMHPLCLLYLILMPFFLVPFSVKIDHEWRSYNSQKKSEILSLKEEMAKLTLQLETLRSNIKETASELKTCRDEERKAELLDRIEFLLNKEIIQALLNEGIEILKKSSLCVNYKPSFHFDKLIYA